tara:strand:- start:2088 stop:2477 length:390 start_codon:yes stop_codon:yes gene_type:complete
MAKDKEEAPVEEETAAEETAAEETAAEETAQEAPAAPQRVAVQVDDSGASCSYANFCRVTGSPEELIIDFALNPQPMGVPSGAIDIDQRVVMNYYTAKRLLAALQMSVQRHEAVFGVLETDINKRVASQ